MKILIAHSKDDRNIHDNCKRTIERTSPLWTLEHYVVDEGDLTEPNGVDKEKLKNADYFVLIHTRRIANNYFGNGDKVRKLLREGCDSVVYRVENCRRPSGFDDFGHLEGQLELEDHFTKQYDTHKESIRGKAKSDRILSVFRKNLTEDGIVYFAYYFFTSQVLREDLFDDCLTPGGNRPPANLLSAFMKAKQFTPAKIRGVYDNIFENCLASEVAIESVLNAAEQGDLVRVVFDVRTGAFYLNEIEGSHYVCGATVNQYKVYEMEQVMRTVCQEIAGIENSPF